MPKRKQPVAEPPAMVTQEELAEAVSQDTAALELERLQKKIAREERKKRREIEAANQKKAVWLLPSLLFVTMCVAWIFSRLNFDVPAVDSGVVIDIATEAPVGE